MVVRSGRRLGELLGRRRRGLGNLAGVTVATTLALGTVVAPAPAALADGRVLSYGAAAESWGLDVRVVPVAQQEEVADVTDSYFPHTQVDINATPHATADGEFFDPGALARSLPQLVDGQLYTNHAPPIVPSYPYVAHTTSDPGNPRDVDAGTQTPFQPEPGILPVTVPGVPHPTGFALGTAHAHADAAPHAVAAGAVGAIDLAQVTVQSISGGSEAAAAGGTVTASTTAVLHGVSVLGVLDIASETVTASVRVDASGHRTATGSVTYSGVTVAGTAATIDQDGLHIGGNGVSTAQAQAALQQLNAALAASGARLVGSQATGTAQDAAGQLTETADGFAVSFADPQHTVSVLVSFGHATATAHLVGETSAALPVEASGGAAAVPNAPAPPPASLGGAVTLPFTPPSALPSPSRPGHGAHPVTATVVRATAAGLHPVVLFLLAGLAELLLLATVACAAWLRWAPHPPAAEDLLAL